jgi:hypothetical protein
LKELPGPPQIRGHLIFKGGTSLSKVFKVIERLAGDIDVSLDRGFLGFVGANEPEAGASNKEKQRRIEAPKTACQRKIAKELPPALEAAIQAKLRPAENWSLRSYADDPNQPTLLFEYPTSFLPETIGCIRRLVKIKMGGRADHWPSESKTIPPYVAEQLPEQSPSAPARVPRGGLRTQAEGRASHSSGDLRPPVSGLVEPGEVPAHARRAAIDGGGDRSERLPGSRAPGSGDQPPRPVPHPASMDGGQHHPLTPQRTGPSRPFWRLTCHRIQSNLGSGLYKNSHQCNVCQPLGT